MRAKDNIRRDARLLTLFLVLAAAGVALPLMPSAALGAELAALRQALAAVRFVAYTPRAFVPSDTGQAALIAPQAIAQDLDLLRGSFDGLIAYSTRGGLEALPELAQARGFRALVLGVWNPRDRVELAQAVALARRYPRQIIGLAIGNEGLFSARYSLAELVEALRWARREIPSLPLSTSEPFAWLLEPAPELLAQLDFLLPNIHPLTETWFSAAPEQASWQFVINVLGMLRRHGKPILVKETGLPSGPANAGLSPQRQARIWQELLTRLPDGDPDLAIAAFEAFDAPWKPAEIARHHPIVPPGEDAWGFFTAAGKPKPVLEIWRHARPLPGATP